MEDVSEETRGACVFCQAQMTRGGMLKHLRSCSARLDHIEEAGKSSRTVEPIIHLRLFSDDNKDYWLNMEARASATFEMLDHYLRAIWLECCGHLSMFNTNGWRGVEIAMDRQLGSVFRRGRTISHIYDFGTPSHTLIKAIDVRKGKPLSATPIFLMARNELPETECMECKRTAKWLCIECLIEEDAWGVLCDMHAKKHPHRDYGDPVPLVNSPRLGLCGYDGPAEPPY